MSEAAAASRHPLHHLFDPGTVRARCCAVLHAVDDGVSEHFRLDRAALPALAERVARLTLERFPTLEIPYHSRWRHFEAGGIDRKPVLEARLAGAGADAAEAARARFDLTVVSVLLDAGAGPAWAYTESEAGGRRLVRSEGLGVASWHAFLGGRFSSQAEAPLRVDAAALERIDAAALRQVFQAAPSNPLVGLEGRAGLLQRLGATLRREGGPAARPALMFDRLTAQGSTTTVAAAELLRELLRTLGPIWTSGSRVQGLPAGDVWPHRWAGAATGSGALDSTTAGWVPFHKLSQWLAYSLLEPLQWAGVEVTGLEALTGLPEYRNGGLLLDGGVLLPRDARALAQTWKPADDFIVEWRACAVALLDELAALVRQRLGRTAAQLPLACVLEGGTWAAGRQIAAERREGGAPPLKIESDGTVF